MTTPLAANDLWRTIINGTLINRHFHIALDWQLGTVSAPAPNDLDLANYVDLTFGPLIKALMCNPAVYNSVTTRRLNPVVARPVFQISTAHSGVGTAGADPMAGQTTGLITKYTALMGRANRGRIYIPFPAVDDDTATGAPSASYQSRLVSFANAYTGTVSIPGGGGGAIAATAIVFHPKTLTGTPIATTQSQFKWATQRRRGQYKPPRRRKH